MKTPPPAPLAAVTWLLRIRLFSMRAVDPPDSDRPPPKNVVAVLFSMVLSRMVGEAPPSRRTPPPAVAEPLRSVKPLTIVLFPIVLVVASTVAFRLRPSMMLTPAPLPMTDTPALSVIFSR